MSPGSLCNSGSFRRVSICTRFVLRSIPTSPSTLFPFSLSQPPSPPLLFVSFPPQPVNIYTWIVARIREERKRRGAIKRSNGRINERVIRPRVWKRGVCPLISCLASGKFQVDIAIWFTHLVKTLVSSLRLVFRRFYVTRHSVCKSQKRNLRISTQKFAYISSRKY